MAVHQAFGEWLADMLRQRGLSQKELADMIGVTAPAVNGWVNSRSEPRYGKIAEIAGALGVDVEDAVNRRQPAVKASELEWVFRAAPEDGGRDGGNAAAFAFAANLEVLVREAVQNALDEKLAASDTVIVRFVLHELTGSHLGDFKDALGWNLIEQHLRAAADRNQKAGRVLLDGLNELQQTQRLILLRVDDYNTAGLTGSEYADGRFARVVRRTLDSGKSGVQGGSYGLGKAALWAASRFGLVLVNSTLSESEDGRRERRMAGRLELPWHELDGEEYAGPAWFGSRDHSRERSARSWWGDAATAKRLHLERTDGVPGTSFLVVGAYDGSGATEKLEEMHDRLLTSVGRNFWASMVGTSTAPPLLEASVAALRNGRQVRGEEQVDPDRLEPSRSRAIRAFLEKRTVTELTEREDVLQATVPLTLPELKSGAPAPTAHEAVLLLTPAAESEGTLNQISYMRATRMVVRNKRVGDLPLGHRPFQAVLLAGRATLGSSDAEPADSVMAAEELLRTAEPPDHNDWTSTEDLTATYVRGAAARIADFKKAAEQRIRELLKVQEGQEQPDETPGVLRDLLRLDIPKSGRRMVGYPTVKDVQGSVDEGGAWHVEVTVRLPEREDPWVLRPYLRFVARSGSNPPVNWAEEFRPLRNCELTVDGDLKFRPGARTGVFAGISDPSSHPVNAALSCVEVDVPRVREVRA